MSSPIELARAGFAELDVSPAVRQAALENLELWLGSADFDEYRPQLDKLCTDGRFALLLDSFYQVLPFGTGGRRGPVGPGTNRFNVFTLATSVAGHIEFLKDRFGTDGLRVVIAHDTRQFHDLKGLYDAELLGSLLGMTSRAFAEMAAGVYTGAGIEVFLPPVGTAMATPELSFAIRRLEAHGGLNVSASHNPPDDNGGKFYDHRGGQEVPPLDQQMVDRVVGITRVDATGNDALLHVIPPEVHQAYIDLNRSLSVSDRRDARVVFTPLHGTGLETVGEVLRVEGFDVRPVPAQSEPDGRFPAVPFGVANPEVPASMDMAVEEARRVGADLVLATDPDADRIGARVPDGRGDWVFLTGNELGALVVDAVLDGRRRRGTLPARPLVMRTEVTSDLVSRVARAHGAQVIDHLLVGFKYVAAVLDEIERTGRFDDREFAREDFVVAIEESHGVLMTPEIRDKDAAGPGLVLAEIAAEAKAAGRTVIEVLDDLYRRVGYVGNRLTSVIMKGAAGQEAIATIQDRLRAAPPTEVGGTRVMRFFDHWDESPGSRFGPIKSDTDRASRNVLVFHLEDQGRVIIRPSGTEPKNKTYVEVGSEPLADGESLADRRAAIDERARALEAAFVSHCLGLIDIELPDWGHRISGLVSLDCKLDFVGTFQDEFGERAAAVSRGELDEAALAEWIDARLKDYGRDARGLTADAFRAFADQRGEALAGDAAALEILAIQRRVFLGEGEPSRT
jgi:phosphoglucomutase/phosphomannomutase